MLISNVNLSVEEEIEIDRFFKGYSAENRKEVESWSEYQMALRAGKVTMALEVASVILESYLPHGFQHGRIREQFRKILGPYFPDY
jgi:hypothetical protein